VFQNKLFPDPWQCDVTLATGPAHKCWQTLPFEHRTALSEFTASCTQSNQVWVIFMCLCMGILWGHTKKRWDCATRVHVSTEITRNNLSQELLLHHTTPTSRLLFWHSVLFPLVPVSPLCLVLRRFYYERVCLNYSKSTHASCKRRFKTPKCHLGQMWLSCVSRSVARCLARNRIVYKCIQGLHLFSTVLFSARFWC